ncbi:hypothetical protein B0H15DRAFT_804127 [Mycena belliarum]|uniref:Uncharacterized protein n=1 Tax=Mycena belliarum TaxID=1033014 RepID=A0AAD6TZ37_9AGAR|nr:hypothetical protein B0H15DRAFT_804127 [Mycena belliae]
MKTALNRGEFMTGATFEFAETSSALSKGIQRKRENGIKFKTTTAAATGVARTVCKLQQRCSKQVVRLRGSITGSIIDPNDADLRARAPRRPAAPAAPAAATPRAETLEQHRPDGTLGKDIDVDDELLEEHAGGDKARPCGSPSATNSAALLHEQCAARLREFVATASSGVIWGARGLPGLVSEDMRHHNIARGPVAVPVEAQGTRTQSMKSELSKMEVACGRTEEPQRETGAVFLRRTPDWPHTSRLVGVVGGSSSEPGAFARSRDEIVYDAEPPASTVGRAAPRRPRQALLRPPTKRAKTRAMLADLQRDGLAPSVRHSRLPPHVAPRALGRRGPVGHRACAASLACSCAPALVKVVWTDEPSSEGALTVRAGRQPRAVRRVGLGRWRVGRNSTALCHMQARQVHVLLPQPIRSSSRIVFLFHAAAACAALAMGVEIDPGVKIPGSYPYSMQLLLALRSQGEGPRRREIRIPEKRCVSSKRKGWRRTRGRSGGVAQLTRECPPACGCKACSPSMALLRDGPRWDALPLPVGCQWRGGARRQAKEDGPGPVTSRSSHGRRSQVVTGGTKKSLSSQTTATSRLAATGMMRRRRRGGGAEKDGNSAHLEVQRRGGEGDKREEHSQYGVTRRRDPVTQDWGLDGTETGGAVYGCSASKALGRVKLDHVAPNPPYFPFRREFCDIFGSLFRKAVLSSLFIHPSAYLAVVSHGTCILCNIRALATSSSLSVNVPANVSATPSSYFKSSLVPPAQVSIKPAPQHLHSPVVYIQTWDSGGLLVPPLRLARIQSNDIQPQSSILLGFPSCQQALQHPIDPNA